MTKAILISTIAAECYITNSDFGTTALSVIVSIASKFVFIMLYFVRDYVAGGYIKHFYSLYGWIA